ncbi:arginase family protein, partial [Salinicola peritrichatus]|uniref:arginase family protein n=1 Tax=Salinicola peritrichatus TaxID=1267424 RepID=UPI000DA1495E
EYPGIKHLDRIVGNISSQQSILEARAPKHLLTLACECSGDIAPITYFRQRHSDLVVLWVDAHADLNTPQSSPSGDFHGMPLRTLIGDGPDEIVSRLPAFLKAEQIGMVGVRDIDPAERCFINARMIRIWPRLSADAMKEINEFIEGKHVYLHFDLDVIDPSSGSLALFEVPGGIELKALVEWMTSISQQAEIIGVGMFEYNDPSGMELGRYSSLVMSCLKLLGFQAYGGACQY